MEPCSAASVEQPKAIIREGSISVSSGGGPPVRDFSDATFSPEVIEAMTTALEQAVATLPEPVSAAHVNLLAESILRSAKSGERDIAVLQRLALIELQISPR
jgi:hypothetical protein